MNHRHAVPHHHGDHAADIDWESLGTQLEREAELHLPALRGALDWLRDGPLAHDGARAVRDVLDLGCGPGVVSGLLAEAFPDAVITGVDAATALLERARDRAVERGLGDRVHTRIAHLPEELEELDHADLLWSGHFLHHLGDQQAALTRMAGLLRPGGTLVVREGGLPARFLPRDIGFGRPGLQARLDAANEEWFTAMRRALPGSVPVVEDWPTLITKAGLVHGGSRTFLTELPAPLDDGAREYLHARLTRLRETVGDHLDADDRAALDRLVDPDDDAGVLHRPDVFHLSATTVHTGRAPRPSA